VWLVWRIHVWNDGDWQGWYQCRSGYSWDDCLSLQPGNDCTAASKPPPWQVCLHHFIRKPNLLPQFLLFVTITEYSFLLVFSLPSVLWRCWLGSRKGIRPVKNWVVGCWHGYLPGARCRLAYAQRIPLPLTVSCFSKIQTGFTFLVPTHLGSTGQRPLNGCVCVSRCNMLIFYSVVCLSGF